MPKRRISEPGIRVLLTITLLAVAFATGAGHLSLSAVYATENASRPAWGEGVQPTDPAEGTIVYEIDTGTVLFSHHAKKQFCPASITKVMTALLALENSEDLSEIVTFSENAVYTTYGNSIYRSPGEELKLEDCLYALMLVSANDAAYAIAEHVGGDYDTFISMMNEKAAELGCKNTHFTNPHGLPDAEHLTTAADMARIAAAAYQIPKFREIIATLRYKLPKTNIHDEPMDLIQQHNMRLENSGYYDADVTGGKTGYTDVARNTLVTYAERDGLTLCCVILNAPQYTHYNDTRRMLDYAFENFKAVTVKDEAMPYPPSLVEGIFPSDADLTVGEGVVVLPKAAELSDATATLEAVGGTDAADGTADNAAVWTDIDGNPVMKVAARVNYSYGKKNIGSVELLTPYVEESEGGGIADFLNGDDDDGGFRFKLPSVDFSKLAGLPKWVYIVVGIVLAIAVAIGVFAIVKRDEIRRYRAQMRRYRERQKEKKLGTK